MEEGKPDIYKKTLHLEISFDRHTIRMKILDTCITIQIKSNKSFTKNVEFSFCR